MVLARSDLFMDSRRPPCATVFLILTVLEPSTASARADQPIAALAPVETVLEGRDELIGVAITADGTLTSLTAGPASSIDCPRVARWAVRLPGSIAPPASPSTAAAGSSSRRSARDESYVSKPPGR